MRADTAFYLGEPIALGVEPVEIAVEDDGDVRLFRSRKAFNNVECKGEFP